MLTALIAQAGDPDWLDQLKAAVSPDREALAYWEILLRLGCAVLVGWVLGLGYRLSYTGKRLKPTMHHTLIMLCLGGAFVWLVVGNNIVRAFGLAGTIGLIRYRTTLRDPKDTTILFFAMVMGMAIGLGHIDTAIIGCLFVFSALVLMRLTYTPPPPKEKDEDADEAAGAASAAPPATQAAPPTTQAMAPPTTQAVPHSPNPQPIHPPPPDNPTPPTPGQC